MNEVQNEKSKCRWRNKQEREKKEGRKGKLTRKYGGEESRKRLKESESEEQIEQSM